MYKLPEEYKCTKCGSTAKFSVSKQFPFWPVDKEDTPFCYQCLIKFISENVPLMEKTSK